MRLRIGVFKDEWRGDGAHVTYGRCTFALRWRWHLRFVRPPYKPGVWRLYIGPLELEWRAANTKEQP